MVVHPRPTVRKWVCCLVVVKKSRNVKLRSRDIVIVAAPALSLEEGALLEIEFKGSRC